MSDFSEYAEEEAKEASLKNEESKRQPSLVENKLLYELAKEKVRGLRPSAVRLESLPEQLDDLEESLVANGDSRMATCSSKSEKK